MAPLNPIHRIFTALVLIFLAQALFTPTQAGADAGLTPAEKQWIRARSTPVVIGAETDWPPFDFVLNSRPTGISNELARMAAEKAGLAVTFVHGFTWGELVEKLKAGEIDVLPCIYQTEERRNFMAFTSPYAANPSVLIVRETLADIRRLEELRGKRVAVVPEYATARVLAERFPDIRQVPVKNPEGGLKAVSLEQADAFIGSLGVVTHIMDVAVIPNIRITGEAFLKEKEETELHMGVMKENAVLRDILEKGLAAVTREELRELRRQWLPYAPAPEEKKATIKLTRTQMDWLRDHPTIRLGIDRSFIPFEFEAGDGTYSGAASEYIRYFEGRLGVEMTPVKGLAWSEVLEKARNRELDLLPCVVPTPEREEYLLFTKPYLSFPVVIFARKDFGFIGDLSDLDGHTVAVVKGYAAEDFLKEDHPGLDPVRFPTVADALQALATGRIDVFINELGSSSFTIDKLGLTNLKVAASTDYRFDLSMGVRKDWPELVAVLDRALASVTPDMAREFRGKWFSLAFEHKTDIRTIMKWVGPIAGVLVLALGLVVAWNRSLGREISERKAAELKIRAMSDASHDAVIMINGKGEVMFWNTAAETIFGITAKEAMGHAMHGLFVPERHRRAAIEGLRRFEKTGKGPVIGNLIEQTAIRKNGDRFPVEIAVSSFNHDDAWYAVGSVRDITERKTAELQLQKNETKYRELVENANSIIIKLDTKGRITFFNEFAQKFFGFSAEEIIGKSVVGTIVPEKETSGRDLEDMMADIVVHPERYETNENENTCKDGRRVWVSWTNRAVFTGDNPEVSELLCIGRDITEEKKARAERDDALELVRDSIQYAALIQSSLIPDNEMFYKYFSDHFVIWHPRDIVGGDIFLFDELRNDTECLLMVIDCTGHGVPGAFVTMLVKAIERQVVTEIQNHPDREISPARILTYFNRGIKKLLKQDDSGTVANAGFDGGLLYFNREKGVVKFAGAATPLFYTDNGTVRVIKGDRQSIGYKGSDADYRFSEHTLAVKPGMTLYLTTDGYLDQVGGPKGFSFGKKRFKKLIQGCSEEIMADQKEFFLYELAEYQGDKERRDDVTVVGLRI